jgi:hypothetical protein
MATNPFIIQANPATSQTLIDPDSQALQRQKQYASMLMQQNQMPQGQMIGNRFVAPSWTQQLSSAINPLVGAYMMKQADTKQTELAEALRQQGERDLRAYGEAITPRAAVEAKPEVIPQGQTMLDDQGVPTIGYQAAVQAVPEKKANFAEGLSILRNSKDPETRALGKALMADMFKTQKLGEGETLVRQNFAGEFVPVGGEGGAKKTTDVKNYEEAVRGGFKGSFNDWFMQKQKASGVNVSVNTAKDLTGQIGDISKESRISAMGAVQTADAANRIIQAVDTGKIFQGAGANQRLTAAQIADGLGFGGKDTAEKIANSRQAIQGLAQLTLQGRKQMRGEGAITESEGALAQRAMSGDITLTGPEIRQLAEAAKRSAKFQYGQHQNIINTMRADPNTRGLVPYYDVPADSSIFNPRAVGGQSNVRNEADAILGGSNR